MKSETQRRSPFSFFPLVALFLGLADNALAQRASSWRTFKIADGLAETACVSVSSASAGQILVTHPNSNFVSVLDGYFVKTIPRTEAWTGSVEQSAGGQLWAVATNGLMEFRNGEWIPHRVQEIAVELQGQLRDEVKTIPLYPVRQSRVLFLLRDKLMEFNAEDPDHPRIEVLRNIAQSQLGFFSSLTAARDGGLWIGGERGLARVTGPVRDLSSISEWAEFLFPLELNVRNIRAIEEDAAGGITAIAETTYGRQHAVLRFETNSWRVLTFREKKILRAWRASDKSFWVVTGVGLFRIAESGTGFAQADEIPAREILDVAVEPNGVFWLATSEGLFRHAAPLWRAPENGETFPPSPEPSSDSKSTAGSAVSFTARNGDVWLSVEGAADILSAESMESVRRAGNTYRSPADRMSAAPSHGVARFRDQKWEFFPRSDKNIPAVVVAFAELPDEKIIAATDDKLWEFDGRNWSSIRAGFTGINALLHARDGSLWVASTDGAHRLRAGAWIENNLAEGLASAEVRQLREDQHGRLWAQTAGGVNVFHPEADMDAPRTSIAGLADAKGRVPEDETVALKLSAEDRWKFTSRERLLYSHRLDEREWTAFEAADEVTFSDLPPGKHYFQARAMDRNGNVDANPARIEFIVTLPWFKEARLIVIAFAGTGVALFFAAVAFNRHRQLRHSYAEVEQKIAERTRELEMANRELLHSQKMNALGTIAAGIAHDFNNILSIIKGSTQLIEENLDHPQKIRTRLDRIKTVVQQGAGIVEAMLGFSRSSDERAVPCDLNAVVDDTLTLLGERFGREVEVQFQRGDDLPKVFVARDLVQQVLLNFIFNAAESMHEQKRIILSTRQIESLPPGMVLLPAKTKSYLIVSVKDFGCGISPENLPRVFEPFFTTKALSIRRGMGLGLSMVYELAKKLEAGLMVESVVGQGSAFSLILPLRATLEKLKLEKSLHHVSEFSTES